MSEIVFISLSEILKWSFFFFFFFFQGMKPMTIHVVDLLEDLNPSINEESKVSSVNQRMRLLGTLLQQPQVWQSTFSLSLFFLNCYFSFFLLYALSLCLTNCNIMHMCINSTENVYHAYICSAENACHMAM